MFPDVLNIPVKANVRWFDMPTAQVELDHRNESRCWILDFGHRQECFRMCHEAIKSRQRSARVSDWIAYFVIRSSIDFGSKMNVGKVTLFRSAPGRNCDMICESTTKPTALQYPHQHRRKADPVVWLFTDHCPDLVPPLEFCQICLLSRSMS